MPRPNTVLEALDHLGPPGTPVTTSEVAEECDWSQRTAHDKLESLVDDGVLQMKQVGANSHVWWRPAEPEQKRSDDAPEGRPRVRSHPVFHSELVGVIVWGDDLTIRDANDAFLEMVGLDYEDALGTSWEELTPDEFHPVSQRHISEVEETGRGVPYEKQYYHADGSRWWGLFESRRLNDSEKVEFVVEITERKERERELHQKTRAIDEAPIGIVLTDPDQADNPLIYVNDAFTDLTGYSKSDAIGRNCRFLQGDNTDPETVARIRAGIDGEERVSETIRNYRKDGTEFWNHLELAPVRNADGELINYVGFQQDVTDRRERRRHLQTIDRVLRHNLNNDLNVIQGMAELIQEEGNDPLTDYAQRIIDTGDRLLATMEKERKITALLDDEPVLEAVELTRTLQSVVDSVRAAYPSATVDLSVPDQAVVRATAEIHTAIEELLSNALEHNDTESPHVHVAVTETASDIGVRVTDNGPGIPGMERDILLGKEEMTPLYHGKGLGLWLVQLIVRRSSGTLEFEVNELRGSVVTVQLQAANTE